MSELSDRSRGRPDGQGWAPYIEDPLLHHIAEGHFPTPERLVALLLNELGVSVRD